MKRIIVILSFIILMVGCSTTKSASYTFTNDSGSEITDVMLCEYNSSGDKIKTNHKASVSSGSNLTLVADEYATKMKVRFTIDTGFFSTKTRWISQVYILQPGKTIEIILNDSTIVSVLEP